MQMNSYITAPRRCRTHYGCKKCGKLHNLALNALASGQAKLSMARLTTMCLHDTETSPTHDATIRI